MQIGRPLDHSNSILSLLFFSADGDRTILAAGDGDVVLYDLDSRRRLGEGLRGLDGTDAAIDTIIFDRESGMLLTAGRRQPIVAWNTVLWTSDNGVLREHACRLAARNLTAEEWAEVFRDTRLEDERRETCPGR